MKNKDLWMPTKYEYINGKLRASRNSKQVMPSSRLIANSVAALYDIHLSEHAKGKLLDLGCGTVPLYGSYKNCTTDVICVDWGNTLHKNMHLDFEHDLNTPLPFEDSEFDTIILSDVLEHIYEPKRLWSEIHRILKKNGKIIMNVPFYYWLHEEPYDYFRYTKFTLQRMAEEKGMKIMVLEPYGGAIEICADIISKLLIKVKVVGKPLCQATQGISFWFSTSRLGKKIKSRTSMKFPFGYFLIAEK